MSTSKNRAVPRVIGINIRVMETGFHGSNTPTNVERRFLATRETPTQGVRLYMKHRCNIVQMML